GKRTFIDSQVILDMKDNSQQAQMIKNFWSALAVCHTVLTDHPEGDPYTIDYKAQSPDEAALVSTARDVGFVFVEQKQDNMILEVLGQTQTYELLSVLEFNSTRKRMSVIVRPPEGGIMLI